MKRSTFIRGLGAAIALGPAALSGRACGSADQGSSNPDLTRINPKFLITAQNAHAWHAAKDSHGGPTFFRQPVSDPEFYARRNNRRNFLA